MLIQKGYKVARVEQTETPDMATERCKESQCLVFIIHLVIYNVCNVHEAELEIRMNICLLGDKTE